jgi:hypothetical protein
MSAPRTMTAAEVIGEFMAGSRLITENLHHHIMRSLDEAHRHRMADEVIRAMLCAEGYYIAPEMMATHLATLEKAGWLHIGKLHIWPAKIACGAQSAGWCLVRLTSAGRRHVAAKIKADIAAKIAAARRTILRCLDEADRAHLTKAAMRGALLPYDHDLRPAVSLADLVSYMQGGAASRGVTRRRATARQPPAGTSHANASGAAPPCKANQRHQNRHPIRRRLSMLKPKSPSNVSAPQSIAPAKVSLIHVARRQLDLSEEDYRAVLSLFGGVASAKELDQRGFTAVMARLEHLGFRSTSPRRPMTARTGMASPGQTSFIRQLWAECTQGAGTDATLGKWLERQFGVSSLRFVSADLAPKVIGGLKAMKGRLAQPSRPSAA